MDFIQTLKIALRALRTTSTVGQFELVAVRALLAIAEGTLLLFVGAEDVVAGADP